MIAASLALAAQAFIMPPSFALGAPPEVVAAGTAWNECIQSHLNQAPPEERPRVATDRILSACTPAADAMRAANLRWVEGSDLRPRDRRAALRRVDDRIAALRGLIPLLLRAMRED